MPLQDALHLVPAMLAGGSMLSAVHPLPTHSQEPHYAWFLPTWRSRVLPDCAAQPATHSPKQHYSWFLPTWRQYNKRVLRSDAIRPFILHRYGGLYLDLDIECYRCVPMHVTPMWRVVLHPLAGTVWACPVAVRAAAGAMLCVSILAAAAGRMQCYCCHALQCAQLPLYLPLPCPAATGRVTTCWRGRMSCCRPPSPERTLQTRPWRACRGTSCGSE